jgi:hypothetical protein
MLTRIFTIPFLFFLPLLAQSRDGYRGDEACRSCHAVQVESFHQTAHYLTSSLPNEHSILGNFTPGENVLKTANPNLVFHMEAKQGKFFQTSPDFQQLHRLPHATAGD